MKLSIALPLILSVAVASVSCARYIKDLENAVDANNVRNARRAIGKGAPVDSPITNEGVTALMISAELGKVEMINFLASVAGASMVKVDSMGYNPLHFAAGYSGSFEGLKACLAISNAGIDAQEYGQGNTPLHFAAATGSIEKVAALIEAGGNFKIKNEIGNTAIIAACYHDNLEVLEYLLERGADYLEVNSSDEDCLAIASSNNCLKIAAILLNLINPTKRNCNTGIVRAISYAKTEEMTNLLLEYFPGTVSFTGRS
jgi:ankyrin repeat protein